MPAVSTSMMKALVVTAGLLLALGVAVKVRRARLAARYPTPAYAKAPATASPGPSGASSEAEAEASWPAPEPDDSPVLARYDGGEVTENELRQRTSRLPLLLRGMDNAMMRKWRVRTLVKEELLALEASRRVTDLPEWRDLPVPLQQRLRIRALVDRQTPSERKPEALAQARLRTLNKLEDELSAAAHVSLDTARIEAFRSTPGGLRWQPWERQAARASLRDAPRPLYLVHDDLTLDPCTGQIFPGSASFDARCECESLAEQFFDEDVLYFDLYLSERGPNVLFASNFMSAPCREVLLSSSAPAMVAEKQARETTTHVDLKVEAVKAPVPADAEQVPALLSALAPRFGECLTASTSDATAAGVLHVRWTLEEGMVDSVQTATEGPGSLAGTSAEFCLRLRLASWRMVGVHDGPYSARLNLKTTTGPLNISGP